MKGVGSSVAFLCLYRGCGRVLILKCQRMAMGLNKLMRYVHEVRKIVIPQLYLLIVVCSWYQMSEGLVHNRATPASPGQAL
jgi:hypothetical protein